MIGSLLILSLGLYFYFHYYSLQNIPPIKIAIVDGTRLKKEAQPFLDVMAIVKEETEEINHEINKKRGSLKKISKLSKDPKIHVKRRAEYRKQFEHEFALIELDVQKKKDVLRRQILLLEKTVSDVVMDVIQGLAKKYHLNLILNTKVMDIMTVFYASHTIDLTDEVIKLLNKKLKNISLIRMNTLQKSK